MPSECPIKLLERLRSFARRTAAAAEFASTIALAAKHGAILSEWFAGAAGDPSLTWDTKTEIDIRIRYGKTELTLSNMVFPLAVVLRAVDPLLTFLGEMLAKLEADVSEFDSVLSKVDPSSVFYCPPPSNDEKPN